VTDPKQPPAPATPPFDAPEAYEPPVLHEAGNLRDLLGKTGGNNDQGSMMNPYRP
jgi:hypothetical protein